MAAFLIVIHLGFASATALSSAMIPIVISIVVGHNAEGLNPIGVTMLMQYAICFGLVLPVNSPQGMVAYGTDTFDVKTFMTTGIPTIIYKPKGSVMRQSLLDIHYIILILYL